MLKKLLFIALLFLSVSSANAVVVQWEVAAGGNGHFYEAVLAGGDITWEEARIATDALGDGWHLATITSAEENAFVENLIVGNSDFFNCCLFPSPLGQIASGPWLGGSSSTLASQDWSWVTGEPFTFQDWGPTAPFGNGDRISFALFTTSLLLGWNDLPDSYPSLSAQSYIIETSTLDMPAVPVPAAVWLFGTALVGLIGFGKRRKNA